MFASTQTGPTPTRIPSGAHVVGKNIGPVRMDVGALMTGKERSNDSNGGKGKGKGKRKGKGKQGGEAKGKGDEAPQSVSGVT